MNATTGQPLRWAELATFRIILDEPAKKLGASFDVYADSLAEIVVESTAHFAIGIFGDWGSGKTTLMEAIRKRVAENPTVVPVWFNAWRYEREQHLIVPLLDTLRAELVTWAKACEARDDNDAARRARAAASVAGRAARALFAGLSLAVGVPSVDIGFDGGKALEAFKKKKEHEAASFYFASFAALQEALAGFFERGKRRVVVFIDDLDRCLPHAALEVLESMKLFFDLEGFVFVVGLDQSVIERSIEAKYQPTTPVVVLDRERTAEPPATGPRPSPVSGAAAGPTTGVSAAISGAEYVKKIFQVPFALPRISVDDLEEFFGELLDNAPLEEAQRTHMRDQLGPHLEFLSGKRAVNPRELKRMMNAYTVQAKMLSAKMRDDFEPQALVVLLTIRFRTEWARLYEALAADPSGFLQVLGGQLDQPGGRVLDEPIPPDFVTYVKGTGKRLLQGDLEPYLSSVEATHAGDPAVGEALKVARSLQAEIASLEQEPTDVARESAVAGSVSLLTSEVSRTSTSSAAAEMARKLVLDLETAVSQLSRTTGPDRAAAVARLKAIADDVLDALRELRQQTATGAAS